MRRSNFGLRLMLSCCAAALLVPATAPAQGWAGDMCTCDNSAAAICNFHGYEITLTNHSVDQDNGASSWDYQVCNNTNATSGFKACFKGKCPDGQGCNVSGQCASGSCSISGTVAERACSTDADCGGGFCLPCVPRQPLSRFYVTLPGANCLASTANVTVTQTGGQSAASLTCQVATVSPAPCRSGAAGATRFAQCDVNTGSSLDTGECVNIRITIPGEVPGLGSGAVGAATTLERFCDESCMLGPSCVVCEEPQPGGCLTRTAGFWGTHPHITAQFLNGLTVCGQPLTTTNAGSCNSVTEALCVSPGRESKSNPAYASLVRQLAAAKLNLAASAASGGGCGPEIAARIAQCEALCGASQQTISASGCIEDLGRFNESQDTVPITPPPFDSPGPAQPTQCQTANGNGIVIGSSCTVPSRSR